MTNTLGNGSVPQGSRTGRPALRVLTRGRDPLTGALTRGRLQEELARAVAAAERYGEPATVCVLDLDNFRFVNEVHGHEAGDRLLASAASAISGRLRSVDALGRIGADEFAIVLARTGSEAARAVAEDLLGAVRTGAVVREGGEEVRATASVGVAVLVPGAETGARELLARAGLAMRAAKEAGRDRVALDDPADCGTERVRDSLVQASRIRAALEGGGLELHAQPIVPTGPRPAPPRYELLVRLAGEPHVAPVELIATAERFGQIQAVDGWVVGRALDLLTRTEDTVLHVNLAGGSIGDPDLMGFVERAVHAAGIAPGRLVFEITETAAIADVAAARAVTDRLRGLGCAMALDDFGAGFASFGYLKHLPFDVLKIDGEFVRDLRESVVDRLVIKSMAEIAAGLGMATVAEYVPDDETLAALRELGVGHAQGYHLGAPRPLADIWGGL